MIPIKNEREIQGMRRAGATARAILESCASFVVPGMTTAELDRLVADKISEAGATSAFLNYRGFPGHCCICINEEVVHGYGDSRRIQYGDIVKLDIGVKVDGWIGDTATTVTVGVIAPEVQRLLDATGEALVLAIRQARPGNRVGDIGAAVENHVTKLGYSVVREFVGHGVGRRLHEDPQIPNHGPAGQGAKLKPGMTLAIEPMVNMGRPQVVIGKNGWTASASDGLPSCHFEHTVLVTRGEPEILTLCQATAALK